MGNARNGVTEGSHTNPRARIWLLTAFWANFAAYSNAPWVIFDYPADPYLRVGWTITRDVCVPALSLLGLIVVGAMSGPPTLRWPSSVVQGLRSAALGVVIGALIVFPVNVAAAIIIAVVFPEDPFQRISATSESYANFGVLYLAGSAALAEEFIFRYLPLAYLLRCPIEQKWIFPLYLVFAVGLFAAVHWTGGARYVVPALLYGWIFATMFANFRNPVSVVVAHFTVVWIVLAGMPLLRSAS